MHPSASTFLLAASLVCGGCSERPQRPVVEPVPSVIVPATEVVKVVPADTLFTVALETGLSSRTNQPGDPFRASVVTPLGGENGDTVVPDGAELAGRVVAVRGAPESAILVRFDTIETQWGPTGVRATFTRAQPDPSVVGDRAELAGYDGALRSVGGIPLFGDDPPAQGSRPSAAPIDLPAGVVLQVVLTQPVAVRALVPSPAAPPPAP